MLFNKIKYSLKMIVYPDLNRSRPSAVTRHVKKKNCRFRKSTIYIAHDSKLRCSDCVSINLNRIYDSRQLWKWWSLNWPNLIWLIMLCHFSFLRRFNWLRILRTITETIAFANLVISPVNIISILTWNINSTSLHALPLL